MRFRCPTRARLLQSAWLLAALLVAALPAQAQWKWRDQAGQITASDLPPPREIPEKDILQRPEVVVRRPPVVPTSTSASAPASAAAPRPPVDKELEARRRAGDQEQLAKARADDDRLAEERAGNCRRARGTVIALEAGQRIARTNDKGEREILDDKGRAEEIRRANGVIASDCR